jgi:hypothetical protein
MPLCFKQQLWLTLIDKALIGSMLAAARFWLNRGIELIKSRQALDNELKKVRDQKRLEVMESELSKCGRYRLTRAEKIAEKFEAQRFETKPSGELRPRYNIAPTQPVPVVRATDSGRVISSIYSIAPIMVRRLRLSRWRKQIVPAKRLRISYGLRKTAVAHLTLRTTDSLAARVFSWDPSYTRGHNRQA